jgi:predicted phage-related endonuclease
LISISRSTIPRPAGRSDWLETRRPYFNASSASVLWDRHRFQSAADYAVEKLTGRGQAETRSMRRGRHLEESIAQWYAQEAGVRLYEPDVMFVAGPILATVDRLTATGPDVLVEIKTANGYLTEPEQYWLDQTQAELLCTGRDHGVIVWLDASMDLQDYEVDGDDAFQTELVTRAERFMAAIELGMVPDWIVPELTAGHVAAVYPHPDGEVELDTETAELVSEYRSLRYEKSEYERAMESIKSIVAGRLGGHAVGTVDGVPIVTFKETKGAAAFDLDSFKQDHPGLFSQYSYIKPSGRRFLPVGA